MTSTRVMLQLQVQTTITTATVNNLQLIILGIFPRISDIIGLHHFTYYVRDIGVDVIKIVQELSTFAKNARLWAM